MAEHDRARGLIVRSLWMEPSEWSSDWDCLSGRGGTLLPQNSRGVIVETRKARVASLDVSYEEGSGFGNTTGWSPNMWQEAFPIQLYMGHLGTIYLKIPFKTVLCLNKMKGQHLLLLLLSSFSLPTIAPSRPVRQSVYNSQAILWICGWVWGKSAQNVFVGARFGQQELRCCPVLSCYTLSWMNVKGRFQWVKRN